MGATGVLGWTLRQPRFFRDCVGTSTWWRFLIPYETWYSPSILQGLNDGDAQRLSGRIHVPHIRGCLLGGFREVDVNIFGSNEALVAAMMKSMMLPLVFNRWGGIFGLLGLRDGELVLDNSFSRNSPLFLDGLRHQLVLLPRPEVDALEMDPLSRMLAALEASQRDVFELLRLFNASGRDDSQVLAAELVPPGQFVAQCANARLNNWDLLNGFRRTWLTAPLLSETGAVDGWRLQTAFPLDNDVRRRCSSDLPVKSLPV